jgi:transcriptional regulator with XRE-family HTH domain
MIRKQLGWSQARLAEDVGVSSNSIARQERGEMGIRESLARLIRLIAEQHEITRTAHSGAGGRTTPARKANSSKARNSIRPSGGRKGR